MRGLINLPRSVKCLTFENNVQYLQNFVPTVCTLYVLYIHIFLKDQFSFGKCALRFYQGMILVKVNLECTPLLNFGESKI